MRSRAVLRSMARWFVHNLAPSACPECGGLLALVLHRSARQVGAVLRPGDPRGHLPSDWLCCESCPYARALDLYDERA